MTDRKFRESLQAILRWWGMTLLHSEIPSLKRERERDIYECNPKTSYCHLSSGFIPLGKIALALKITADDWHRAGYRDTDRLDAMLGRHFKMLTQRLEGHLSFAILLISEMGLSIWKMSIVLLDCLWPYARFYLKQNF